MKIHDKQKLFICLFFLVICASIIFGIVAFPDAVTYTALQKQVADVSQDAITCKYARAFDIKEDGPFYIENTGKNLYICHDGEYLCRINVPKSLVSSLGKASLLSGVEIADRMTLFELIEYIES